MSSSSCLLEAAALKAGWLVRRLANWRAPEEFKGRTDLVAYGEPLFVAAMAQYYCLALIEPPFDWLAKLPEHHIQRRIELINLQDARQRTAPLFAKPADDKCFPAGAYSSGAEIAASNLLPPSVPVLVSEIVSFSLEYRFFVLDRTARTFSIYAKNGEVVESRSSADVTQDQEACAFLATLLADQNVAIPPAVVIDVGKLDNGNWVIVEANPVFGSGIYHCDPDCVLPVLARSLVDANQISNEDKAWEITRIQI